MIREAHDPANAGIFFSADVVAAMQATPLQADPIYGAHDFGGSVSVPSPDPQHPIFRGMITIDVEIENFGRTQTAVFRRRPETGRPGAPLRIFRVEHDGWTFP